MRYNNISVFLFLGHYKPFILLDTLNVGVRIGCFFNFVHFASFIKKFPNKLKSHQFNQDTNLYKLNISDKIILYNLKPFWKSTGLWKSYGYPPDPHQESYKFLLSPDVKLNLFHIGSLGRGIFQVRIHWMLDLIQIRILPNYQIVYDFNFLDQLLYLLWENGLQPGFELMGNPSGYFTDFENQTQVYMWKNLINSIAVHYIEMFGIDYVMKWNFETWNEPDHHDFDELNITVQGFLNYYDACSEGLYSADKRLRFGGPGGSCRIPSVGHSPICWALLNHCTHGKNYFTGKKGVRLDFISFHKKGNASTNLILNEEIETIEYIVSNFPSLINTSIYNDEADPLKNWSLSQWWRADSTYAAMVVKIILDHIYFYYVDKGSELANNINFDLLSSDNAFLSYFPNQFTERTLLARFQVNNTSPNYVEFVRKPVYAAFGLLSKLCPNVLSLNLTSDDQPLKNWGQEFGAIATHCVSGNVVILLYNTADTFLNGTVARVDVNLEIPKRKKIRAVRWAILEINNIKSNPYLVWENIGRPSYPSVEEFSLMKDKEEPCMKGPWDLQNSHNLEFHLNVLNPGVTLINICGKRKKISKVTDIRFFQTWNKTLQISWTDKHNSCVLTYNLLHNSCLHGPYNQVNKKRFKFPSYWHTCYKKKNNCDIKGFYKIYAVDYWGRHGPDSDIFHFKG
ncbi:alpha-L-iduronidase [Caerostris darwini]|uniref:Alpha-L-iduronidase n=1 Tax=Caerostris darwini TaxID=1538125 RepID=A0AAV4TWL4_9ARAC|nr:alpha-L-iduronidase [Caerostris darwini]